jgi:hypothetical protein
MNEKKYMKNQNPKPIVCLHISKCEVVYLYRMLQGSLTKLKDVTEKIN